MSAGCLVLQCCCAPLIALTHLELRLRVHSPMVFLLQMGLSCRSSVDLASHCSCGCRVRTVGTVPVTNSCMTSQNIMDVSIRNVLSENVRRSLIPCKMDLRLRALERPKCTCTLGPPVTPTITLFWKNYKLAEGLYNFRCSQAAILWETAYHIKCPHFPLSYFLPLTNDGATWLLSDKFHCPSSCHRDIFLFYSSGDGISVTSGKVLRWGSRQCITSSCILCCLYRTFWPSHIETAQSVWKFWCAFGFCLLCQWNIVSPITSSWQWFGKRGKMGCMKKINIETASGYP